MARPEGFQPSTRGLIELVSDQGGNMGTVKGNGLSGFAVFRCRRRSGCTRYFRNQVHHGQLPLAFLRGKRLPGLKPRDGRSARRGHPPSSLHPWRSIGRRHARRGLRPFPDPGPETGVAQFKPILLKNSAADHLGGTKKVKSRSQRMIIARKEYSANYSCARLLPYFFQSAQPRLCEKYFGESMKY